MPWKNPIIDPIIEDAKKLVSNLYPAISLTAEVFITTREELLVEAIQQKINSVACDKKLDFPQCKTTPA